MITKAQVTISRAMYERLISESHALADLRLAECIDWNKYASWQDRILADYSDADPPSDV